MADHKTTVGNVELVSLSDGRGDMDPLDMFPESTLEQWRDEYPDLLDGGRVRPRYGSVVLRSGGKTVLVDTGIGAPDGTLLTDLARKGVDREGIELVVITPLHPDHVGWNLSDGRPTFPNARYLVPRVDWDYWTQPSVLAGADHVRDQVMPLEGLRVMDLIEGEYRITDELTSLPTPGHTPGHLCMYERNQRLMFTGDHVLPYISPNVSLHADQEGSSPLVDFRESLRKVAAFETTLALPAHEFTIPDLPQRCEVLLHHHDARLVEVLDAIGDDGPATARAVSARVTWNTGPFDDFNLFMKRSALGETLSHLQLLLDEERVRQREDGDFVVWERV